MSTMFTLAVSVPSNKGTVILQDNYPTEGPFVLTVLPNTTGTVVISDNQFGRIQADLAALVSAGACTYTITMTPSDPLFTALSTAITPGGSLTSPLQYKGSIAVNTSFPLIAVVQSGWMYHITADVTDNAGATYTNTGVAFLAGDEVVWDGSAWIKTGNALTNPFQFKGNIAAATDFPPPAATATTGVKDGWVYRVTTGCTDNNASKTNTGQVFLTGDIIVWRTNAWYLIQKAPSTATPTTITTTASAAGTSGRPSNDDHGHQLTANVAIDKGAIAAPTDFPLVAAVRRGDIYRISNATADTGGVTYTNTGLTFVEGDVIMWTGATWRTLGNKIDFQVTAVTPVVLAANDSVNVVDTATLGAPSAAALPAATALMVGRRITLMDGSGDAAAHNIVITPNGAETINGVNSPYTISKNWGFVTLQCIVAGDWVVVAENANVVAGTRDGLMTSAQATTLAAITDDHVYMSVTGLDMKTDEHEHSGALNGAAGKRFLATHVLVKSSVNVGATNADGTINIGTAADGAQIAAALALTGVGAVDTARMIPLAAHAVPVAGNATLYVNVESAETGAGTLEIDVFVIGRQI